MIEKHKPAIGLYVIALLVFLSVSYFLSGLFLFSNLSIENLEDTAAYSFYASIEKLVE